MLLLKKIIITSALFIGPCILVLVFGSSTEQGWGAGTFAQSVGGTTSGAVSYCTTLNSGVVTVTGYVGTILNWQSSTDGGTIWNNNANSTANQTYFNLNQTTCYRVIVKDGAFPSDTSTIVCISIYPQSVGGTISGGGAFCVGSGAGTLTLSGSSGDILYWQSSTNGGIDWQTIANITNTENYTDITQNTLYHAVVQSDPACPEDTSNQVSFIIDPLTVSGTVEGDSIVCEAANSGVHTLSGHTGDVLGWESSIDSGTSWIPITNTTAAETYLNISQTTWYHAIVKSGACNTDTTPDFIISVSPASMAGTISGEGVYCDVPATGTMSLTGYAGTITGWASSINNGITWTAIANTTITENYSNLALTTWYIAMVQSGVCPADTSNIAIISVAPQTVAGTISGSSVACMGANTDTLVLSGNIGAVTGWLSSTSNGASWDLISNTTSTQVYNGLTETTLYAAIVQSGACNTDTTSSFIITVVPVPAVNAGNDMSITQGQAIQLNGTGAGIPLWSPDESLSDPAIFSPTATPGSSTTYILTVTDSNGCMSFDTVVITVVQSVFSGKVSNLFTPNGDGINDSWYIEGIENFPDNEVFIYTIYGNEVFVKKAYTNDWQGTFNGSDLPDGTYYYVIKFENSDKIVKGAVDILRNK